MQPHLSGQRIRRLIALATAALFALLAPIAPAAVAQAATPAAPAWLDPSAGWHGQAIERPSSTPPTQRMGAASRAAGVLRTGAGLGQASGSAAVRRVQLLLHGLGYGTGPIDGRFGPRTRSAVGWFQHKHGLAVDGVVGPATLSHLNRRAQQGGRPAPSSGTPAARPQPQGEPDTGGDSQAQTPPQQQAQRRPQADTEPPATTTEPRPNGDASSPLDTWLIAAVAVLAILGAILATVLLRRRRRARPEEGTVISLTEPHWVVGRSADPAIGEFAGMATALHVSPPMSGSNSAAAVRYCVIDDRRKLPFWVAAHEITESRKPNGTEHHVPEDLPYRDLASAQPSGRFSRPGARPRRRGGIGRRVPGSDQPVAGRISWLRSLGMPPESIADLLNDQRVPPPPGVAAWTAATVVEAADHREERPPTGGRRR